MKLPDPGVLSFHYAGAVLAARERLLRKRRLDKFLFSHS